MAQPLTTTAIHKIPKIQPPITSVVQCTPRYTREMPTRLASIAAAAQTAIRLRHERIRRLHSQAAAPNTAAAAAACPDGNPNPSAAATAWASGGRERPSAALNTVVSPMTPAQVTASTSTGAHDRQAMPSSRPTASAMTAIPAGPPALLTASITDGERRCPVRRDEPGHRVVQHRYPVTVGDIIHQLAHAGRGQRDGGQSQDERQHECALRRDPSQPAEPGTPAGEPPGPPGQPAGQLGGRPEQAPVVGHPGAQYQASQHHQAAGGEQETGDDHGQLHRLTIPACTSLPPICDAGRVALHHLAPPGAPGKSCMAAYGLLDG